MRKPSTPRSQPTPPAPASTPYVVEAEIATGLRFIVRQELHRVLGDRVRFEPPHDQASAIRFSFRGDLRMLTRLRTVQAVYLVRHFAVPRPKALLGDQHFRALLDLIAAVRATAPEAYRTLYIGAAGSESSVMQRLKAELSGATGLAIGSDEGDLLLRLRRGPGGEGWEALVRIGPRPLATRSWRVQNYGGALNATVAHAMVLLTEPKPDDLFLNVACGSGTLLIERLAAAPARRAIGCDTHPQALDAARANAEASGAADLIELYNWDARDLPLPDQIVDALCADLPFGNLQGSHRENVVLYPAILLEAARVAKPNARFVVVTHEARLMEQVLMDQGRWIPEETIMIGLGGLHPRIYILRRATNDQ